MMRLRSYLKPCILLLTILIIFVACKNNSSPKPRGYYRINLPSDTQRITFAQPGWPYTFDIASFSKPELIHQSKLAQYWCNVHYPGLNASLFISYKPLSKIKGSNLASCIEEAYQMSYKHVVKADYINESQFSIPQHQVYGVLYEIGGDAASSVQFYATDSTHHFLRGSLYFNCTPQRDSLAPAIEFLTHDIRKLLETIQWN